MRFLTNLKSIRSSTAAFVFGIWLTTALMTLIFRGIRIYYRGQVPDILTGIDVYKSDVFFLIGGLLLGLFTLYLIRKNSFFTAIFVALSVFLGLAVVAIETIAFQFFRATGSTVDFSLIYYTLQNFEETKEVLNSELPLWLMIVMVGLILFYLILPIFVFAGWRKWIFREGKVRPPKYAIATGILGLTFLGFGFIPPFKDPSPAFSQNATLHIATSVWEVANENARDSIAADFDTQRIELEGESNINVVFIILESTRATATSLYNPKLDTTPFLKELGNSSLVAKHAYAIVPHTSKALVASLCGIPPNLRMPIIEARKNGIPGRCLAKLLRKKGYQTSFFQSATQRFEDRKMLIKNMGYQDFFPSERLPSKGFVRANYFGREDMIMLKPSHQWLKSNKEKGPVFMTYLTLTPHHNYEAPTRFGRIEYDKDDEFNRYLNTVHYVDQFTKNIFQMFKDEGLYENTIFVIYGDHGEGFGEHGRRQHDNVIWEEGTRIPLLIHHAGKFKGGKEIEGITNQLDIVPTVLPMMGFNAKNVKYPGSDLTQKLSPKRTLFSYCWYDRRCIAIRQGANKYIYHFGKQKDEFYNIVLDPNEKTNTIATLKNPSSWKNKALKWRQSVNQYYQQYYSSHVENYVSPTRPKMSNEVDYNFDNYVKLIGYDLDPLGPYKPGTRVQITAYWQTLKRLPSGYRPYAHGQVKGKKYQNYDHTFIKGFYPIDQWKAEEFITDVYTVKIPYNAKDEYKILMGFYKGHDRLWIKKGVEAATFDLPVITAKIKSKKRVQPLAPKLPMKLNPKALNPKLNLKNKQLIPQLKEINKKINKK